VNSPVFYLGTHQPHWLRLPQFRDIPLFPTRNRLNTYKTLPRAVGRYAVDSNGFTELQRNGRWLVSEPEFVGQIRRIVAGVGTPDFVSPMDWMCEPWVITGQNWHLPARDPKYFHGTREARGLGPVEHPGDDEQPFDDAVRFHQERTVENLLELRRLAPDIPWMPVLQGWELRHYLDCADMYAAAGIDLAAEPIVGLGSVCRRQATSEIDQIVATFHRRGLRLHGFGVKTQGLGDYGPELASADSMAWSYDARRSPPLPGHDARHKNCANCPDWALQWRQRVLARLANAAPRQLAFDLA
jgi:hypothetical protein